MERAEKLQLIRTDSTMWASSRLDRVVAGVPAALGSRTGCVPGAPTSVGGVNGSTVRVGLLGCGTVGSALIQLVQEQADGIESRTGPAPRDHPGGGAQRLEGPWRRPAPRAVHQRRRVGGQRSRRRRGHRGDRGHRAGPPVHPRRAQGRQAGHHRQQGAAGQPRWPRCSPPPRRPGVDVLFEAAVGGGIPLVRPLRESLLGEPIDQVMGIVNGTTNYILTRMTEAGVTYAEALAEAQELGYAEADPDRRRRGLRRRGQDRHPGQHRLRRPGGGRRRLPRGHLGHHRRPTSPSPGATATWSSWWPSPSSCDGRRRRTELAVRVHPVMLPVTHPLASVRGSFNAVFVQGAAVGELMFYGRGAGGNPTASAVLGDLIDASLNLRKGSSASIGSLGEVPVRPDRRARVGLLPAPRRGRPARRAGRGGRCVRQPRRVDQLDEPGPARSRSTRPPRPTWCSSPTTRSSATCRRRCATCASSTSCATWAASSGCWPTTPSPS